MALVKSDSMKASYPDYRNIYPDTAFGAVEQIAAERFRESEREPLQEAKFESIQPSLTEQRLAVMVQSLLEIEARNNELAQAIKAKDYSTMDKHIEFHRQNGNSQVTEWSIA